VSLSSPPFQGGARGGLEKVGLDARPFLYLPRIDGRASGAHPPPAPPFQGGEYSQNAALTENTTWLPAMLDPSLVDEKFGSRYADSASLMSVSV